MPGRRREFTPLREAPRLRAWFGATIRRTWRPRTLSLTGPGSRRHFSFSSGYAANVGVVQALAGPGDLVVSDGLESRLDCRRLSIVPRDGRRRAAPRHRGRQSCSNGACSQEVGGHESYSPAWMATSPNLGRLREVCDEAGAGLVVDEAHAIGALGPQAEAFGALHGIGKRRTCSWLPAVRHLGRKVRSWRARRISDLALESLAVVRFSTGVSPALAALATRISRADGGRRRQGAARFQRLALASSAARAGHGRLGRPHLPCVLGSSARALRAAAGLRDLGALAQAIRPPPSPRALRAFASRRRPASRHLSSSLHVRRLTGRCDEADCRRVGTGTDVGKPTSAAPFSALFAPTGSRSRGSSLSRRA